MFSSTSQQAVVLGHVDSVVLGGKDADGEQPPDARDAVDGEGADGVVDGAPLHDLGGQEAEEGREEADGEGLRGRDEETAA